MEIYGPPGNLIQMQLKKTAKWIQWNVKDVANHVGQVGVLICLMW